MNCQANCPYIGELNESRRDLNGRLENMSVVCAQSDAADAENKSIARTLAKLPNNRETAEARTALQEAIIEKAKAQKQAAEAIDLLQEAIAANENAGELIMNICPGGPLEVLDPTQPGRMILRCASPALAD